MSASLSANTTTSLLSASATTKFESAGLKVLSETLGRGGPIADRRNTATITWVPMTGDKFTRLLAEIEEVGNLLDLERLFEQIAETYGLTTVAYLGAGIGKGEQQREPYVAATYSLDWIERYKAERYVEIDPVVQVGMRRMLPIDWRDFASPTDRIRNFFGEAKEFGVGRRGLSIPVHGRRGDRALFSVTSSVSDRDWRLRKKHSMRDFQVLAVHVHAVLLDLEGAPIPDVRLSPRERECLLWIAEGKTAWECSVILGLSLHTVRCYLESARHKLRASSNTHAVAKAVKTGLLWTTP
ncbi:hypothetical protein GRZ55_19265 [Chelativorans sp. ZYF759]|uniref:LuxR family transcriptional regulator n=1 Tax=Chelativorans sp. ZYF759 TaxID=2692213 RepID=UPI00145D099C|nr:LuxR family transcriptional regulator [Chelativorans sp. ZYF759]NMG41388.1 hypothetical protein [Chelativorans sp. ZYF759]